MREDINVGVCRYHKIKEKGLNLGVIRPPSRSRPWQERLDRVIPLRRLIHPRRLRRFDYLLVAEASTLVLDAAVAAVKYMGLQTEERDGNLSMEERKNHVAQAGRGAVERWIATGVRQSCGLGG